MKNRSHIVLAYSLLATVFLASGLSYLLPAPSNAISETASHWRLVLTMLMATTFCAGAVLFLDGIRTFKLGLRKAYKWFAIGLILFGASLLQWPVVLLTGSYGQTWAASGAIVIPFILATAFMYIGMRQFARLLGVQTTLTSIWFSFSSVLAVAVLSGVLAHFFASNDIPSTDNETYTATVAWSTGYGLLAWLLVWKIRPLIGQAYRTPMAWLALALGMLVLTGFHEYVTSYFLTEADWYVYWGISLWPFIVAGFLFIRGGYAFDVDSDIAAVSQVKSVSAEGDSAYIDSILSIASLASRPADIDAILDGLREVTSSLAPGVPLSDAQSTRLVGVYRQLENYLTTSDPLKSFSKGDLRGLIAPTLRSQMERLDQTTPTPTP